MKKKLVVFFLMVSFVVVSAVGSASFDKGLIGKHPVIVLINIKYIQGDQL